MQAQIVIPLRPPPTAAWIGGSQGRGMSTFPKHVHRSRWTPGSRRLGGTARIFGRPPEPHAPLNRHQPALSIKKGRTATLRNAARPPRESVCAAPARTLFRVLPKCPATLPGPRSSVEVRPPPYLFVAERCDPWLPFVELLLEVAVLRRHRGVGSAWPPGDEGWQVSPDPRTPTTQCQAGQVSRNAPQVSGAASRTRTTVQCRAEPLTCGCRLIGAAPGAGRGPRPPGGAPRAVQVCRPGCGCE